ncbi:26S proteasome non-ATPase regulatory subunit 8 [Cichlidogyrus casuarinus]|uniref:26S proteasome non-ATPase regulatory subunit 8 n=1 Tax=Cichlidogyrus casuarinus TaxID=1844966 RepID=A0ABD2PUB5_9PLAT
MSQPNIEEVIKKFQDLTKAWSKSNKDVQYCENAVKSLRLDLIKFAYLPTNEVKATRRELLIARDTLEIAAYLALEKKDTATFTDIISQLKPYYLDYKDSLPDAPHKYELLGLNLLRLLAEGKLAAFHTELEWLSKEEIEGNIYINHPVSMEQYLMEGNFHKLFLSKSNVPSEKYNFFVDILLNTVRGEISSVISSAYNELKLEDATKLLMLRTPEECKAYGSSQKWKLENNVYRFEKSKEHKEDDVAAKDVIQVMLDYTKELDQII